MPYPSRIFPAG